MQEGSHLLTSLFIVGPWLLDFRLCKGWELAYPFHCCISLQNGHYRYSVNIALGEDEMLPMP
jgi:hypothetical protein